MPTMSAAAGDEGYIYRKLPKDSDQAAAGSNEDVNQLAHAQYKVKSRIGWSLDHPVLFLQYM